MSSPSIIPVILCGGTGTRLWPLSRSSFPKQFLPLTSNSDNSLLQLTIKRIKHLNGIQDPIIICNEEHRFIVAEEMRKISIKPKAILLEPFGRNTAPAIALAALKALKTEKDPLLLILSADHVIEMVDKFIIAVEAGIKYALEDRLLTFGIIPSSPETGYGYIRSYEPLDEFSLKGSMIESFIEKPDLNTAKKLIKDKKYTWNSGMFLFKANLVLQEINKFCPDIFKYCQEALSKDLYDLDFQRLNKDSFSKCPNISIDFAIMEKTNLGTVIPLSAGWEDIGSWDAVWKIAKKDGDGNFLKGNVIAKDTKNSYLRSERRLVAALGIRDMVVIETNDAILISKLDQSQEVKSLVSLLKQKDIPEGIEHKKIFRPWGFYESIATDNKWQVKLITVKPGEKLSLQRHKHRSEHWIVVDGIAKVEIDSKELILKDNQSSYIPLGAKHRLSNPGKNNLILIEVQCGSYLGEDDIQRFEDNYGRTN